jgi:hypothetical protein
MVGNFEFNLVVKLSVKLGYVFISLIVTYLGDALSKLIFTGALDFVGRVT